MTLIEKYSKYLTSIGADESIQDKLQLAADFVPLLTSEQIEDLFITNQQGNEGIILQNAWFFTKHYVLEAKDFQLKQDVDVVLLEQNVKRIALTAENLAPGEPVTKDSRLQVDAGTVMSVSYNLTAVGENCEELIRIVGTRFLPNLEQPNT